MLQRLFWIAVGAIGCLVVVISLVCSLILWYPDGVYYWGQRLYFAELQLFSAAPPPPAPAPPPPPDPVELALRNLLGGNIAFNTPEYVLVGKPQIIEAKLGIDVPQDVLINQLAQAGHKEAASIRVADRMRANLSGGAGFDVSPTGAQEQLVSRQEVTSWTWEVTAKQAGTQYLILTVDAVLFIDGKEGVKNINTFTRKIEVAVGWPQTPSDWFAWLKGWVENIQWLWLTVIPVGLLIWNRLRRKSPKGAPEAPAKDGASSET